MKIFSWTFLCVFLIGFAAVSFKPVYGQEDLAVNEDGDEIFEDTVVDEAEEEEGVVEDEDDGSDALTAEDLEDDADADKISSHKDVTTSVIFNSGVEPVVVAGKKSKGYIHFANGGSNNFIVTSIEGSLRYPQQMEYVIQNFTSLRANKLIESGKEGSFSYPMFASEQAGGRSFGLTILVNYQDSEGNVFQDAVFNSTILIAENDEDIDTENFFMYLMLGGMASLTLFGLFHLCGGKKKGGKSKRPQAAATLDVGSDNVDYEWIPKETLQALQKTPSPRTARRRKNKTVPSSGSESE